jgi:putative DNA primase/helicase
VKESAGGARLKRLAGKVELSTVSLGDCHEQVNDNPLLGAALRYSGERGWHVFPCHWPLPGGGCSCGDPACASPAKHPLTPHGFKDATTDPGIISAWWQRWPSANVAIATGAASNLFVLDADGAEGLAALAELERLHGPLPRGPRVRTPGGGLHLYFAWPTDGSSIRNKVRVGGLPIDVRGEGGYVIAPPSRGVGRPYAREGGRD